MGMTIHGGVNLLHPGGAEPYLSGGTIALDGARIVRADTDHAERDTAIDAEGLLVLPGIIDIHSDAFERQIQPRPESVFSHAIALADTDRQLVANGITTVYHGLTYSWEGGLRGHDAALALFGAIESQRATAQADHRVHLRFETHHTDGVDEVLHWMAHGRIDFLAFNDHLPSIARKAAQPDRLAVYVERARCAKEEFLQRLRGAQSRAPLVPEAIAVLAAACREKCIPMASHDDETCEQREFYESLGVTISEFPRTRDALFAAMALDNRVVMGAPNVLLGGSHCGGLAAADTVRSHMCDMLASDYYYPSLLAAPFRLVKLRACSLLDAWRLVSANPAQSLGLRDRGRIADGMRADLLLVEQAADSGARLVATIAAGKLAYCAEPARLMMRRIWSMAA